MARPRHARNDVTRRAFLGGAAALATLAATRPSFARARTPFGGRLHFEVPWPLGAIDPHQIDDAGAAIFGEALFDPLYLPLPNASGFTPCIAEAPPTAEGRNLRVAIRRGLRTARGRPIDARDVVHALERARTRGARGWLASLPAPRADGRDAIVFANVQDANILQRALSSPLTAVVPSAFDRQTPDGTGPFRADLRDGVMQLARNPAAARGGAFLEAVSVHSAGELEASLRGFETGSDDLGWLGLGLHEPRRGAQAFDAGAVGWAVLATGKEAASWDRPGVAQALANAIPHERLADLQVGASWPTAASGGWGGPPTSLYVREDAPWLVEVAKAVAAAIATPGHEVVARPVPSAELSRRRAAREHALALDVARPLASGALGSLLGLAAADDPSTAEALGRHPPRVPDGSARSLTRQLRVGVVGEIRAQGGRIADLVLPTSVFGAGLDLGASYRAPSRGA